MEKLVYISRLPVSAATQTALLGAPELRSASQLTVFSSRAGAGTECHVILGAWFKSLERRSPLEAQLLALGVHADAYLVTESQIKCGKASADGDTAAMILVRMASRLGQSELRERSHGVLSPALARTADVVVCDAVVRPLSVQAPPLRQLWGLRRPTLDANLGWPVHVASIALPEEYEIRLGVILHTERD